MPNVTIGPSQRSFHRALLASKEFDELDPAEQAAVADLRYSATPAERLMLHDLWEPKGAAFGTHLEALAGNPVFELQQVVHGSQDGTTPGVRPELVLEMVRGDKYCKLTFRQSAFRFVEISGFDRHGNLAGDLTFTVCINGNRDARTIAADTFDAPAVAALIDNALARIGG